MSFVIEDSLHAEVMGSFGTREQALQALCELAVTAWDAEPNRAPCTSWRTCGRRYEVVEYDDSVLPWREFGRTEVLRVDAHGVVWLVPDEGASS